MNENLSEEQIALHDHSYKKAWSLIADEMRLEGNARARKIGFFTRRKLNKAIALFEQTIQIKPDNWASMWALGKIYDRFGNDATAFEWFTKAHRIEPNNSDVVREAALSALNLGKSKEAIELTEAAIFLKPEDSGLVANLALALLFNGRFDEAKEKAADAVEANPNDNISKDLLTLIEQVISGKRAQPKSVRELEGA